MILKIYYQEQNRSWPLQRVLDAYSSVILLLNRMLTLLHIDFFVLFFLIKFYVILQHHILHVLLFSYL